MSVTNGNGSHPRGVVGGAVECCDVISAVAELMVATREVWLELSIAARLQYADNL
jgi:hypothetical protein